MKGFPSNYTPDAPSLFLFVRIQLQDLADAELFEQNGKTLRAVFEDETQLSMVFGATTVGVGDQPKLYLNFWKLRPEMFNDKKKLFASGGTRDLLPAMALVHDIPEYGPVDDLVKLKTQDLLCDFITDDPYNPGTAAHPNLLHGDSYYVVAEYDVASGQSGTFAFQLRAHLSTFEQDNNWVCVSTCFPMTGPLTRFIQVFKTTDAGRKGTMVESANLALANAPWLPPKNVFVLRPAAYDSSRVHPEKS